MVKEMIDAKYHVDLSISAFKEAKEAEIQAVIGAKSSEVVNPGLFGINTLFCTELNSVRNREIYDNTLAYLGPKMMRYPGGTCADNYLWKKNDICFHDWFPFNCDPSDNMDTDAFLDFSAKYGAEPIMVINYRTYSRLEDIENLYKDAEDWLRYVNIEKKAGIKYWELGNELYGAKKAEECKYTPESYGTHYLELRKRLKSIDPNIKLGIILNKDWSGENLVERWNERVMKSVNFDPDFIILHYYATPSEEQFKKKGMGISEKVRKMRSEIAIFGGNPDIPILMTEFNYGSKTPIVRGQTIGHLVGLAQGYMDMIECGFERATIWPLYNSDKRLMQEDDYSITPAGVLFHLLNNSLAGYNIVDVNVKTGNQYSDVRAFISQDTKLLHIIAINRSWDNELLAEISLKDYSENTKGTLNTIISAGILRKGRVQLNDTDLVINQQELTITDRAFYKLPPLSVSFLEIPVNK